MTLTKLSLTHSVAEVLAGQRLLLFAVIALQRLCSEAMLQLRAEVSHYDADQTRPR